jgi:hypothetical protein
MSITTRPFVWALTSGFASRNLWILFSTSERSTSANASRSGMPGSPTDRKRNPLSVITVSGPPSTAHGIGCVYHSFCAQTRIFSRPCDAGVEGISLTSSDMFADRVSIRCQSSGRHSRGLGQCSGMTPESGLVV